MAKMRRMFMSLDELRISEKIFLSAVEVSKIIKADPADIRKQAHADHRKLGFPVVVCGRRVKIPRQAFLHFLEFGRTVP